MLSHITQCVILSVCTKLSPLRYSHMADAIWSRSAFPVGLPAAGRLKALAVKTAKWIFTRYIFAKRYHLEDILVHDVRCDAEPMPLAAVRGDTLVTK